MSVFRNIRVYPNHGSRSAVLTWATAVNVSPGNVFVAYSDTGAPKTWELINAGAPVAYSLGLYHDTSLHVNSGAVVGFYRLLLVNPEGDHFSESIGIYGDITPREYGMVRAIMHREFTELRAANGYPVWHCITKTSGEKARNVDPDTDETRGLECAGTAQADSSYGLPFLGGFHPPILTWIRAMTVDKGTIRDSENDTSPRETDTAAIRMLAFPKPSRGHMIVDPTTDRRYLVGDEIKTFMLRGVIPIAYEATMEFLATSDPRYRFEVPQIDTKNYRHIPYWSHG